MADETKPQLPGIERLLSDSVSPLELLKFAQTIRDYHHKALWEEQKHFTWLISVLLAGTFVLIGAQAIDVRVKLPLLGLLGLLGMATAILAIRVVRREGEYFELSMRRFVPLHNQLFPDIQLPPPRMQSRIWWSLPLAFFRRRLGVRDAFQLILLLFFGAFAILTCSAGYGLICIFTQTCPYPL